jgi:hypothetical protein
VTDPVTEPNRVYLTVLIETDQAPADVQLAALALLNDRYKVVNVNANTIGADDDRSPDVSLVICPVRGLMGAFVDDPDRATDLAKREGAVVIEWSADADYRGEVTV